jgi:hypothetical protein
MTPLQVLERQHGFLLKHQSDYAFRSYLEGCFADHMAWDVADKERGRQYVDATLSSFRYSDAYRVTPDMCDLVQFAADRLDESDRVDRTLAPSPFGFVAFERPLPIWDARGELMGCNYLTWGPMSVSIRSVLTGQMHERPATWITMWNDAVITPDETFARMRSSLKPSEWGRLLRTMGRYGFIGTSSMRDGDQVGSMRSTISEEMRKRMSDGDDELRNSGIDIPPPVGEYTNSNRYVHALWLLLGQTLTDVREERLSKAGQKMAGRMEIPGRVSVIQLRRRESRRSEGETHVEWQHRWLAKGHWRWQPYGDGTVQRIWIAPYVKGPEDRPFVQTEKIYDLRR